MAELTPETAISAGRKHYGAKRYKPALEQFTRAMRLCSCSRGMKRDRCSCKNFEKVASTNASIFHEAMYTCTCPVGETFSKCDKTLHIQALDYRAATFEALGELERARKDAEWILELAPRLPDGYLRLGKIARLQKKHDFAWKVYSAGIEASSTNTAVDSSKVQQLHAARKPLQSRFSRIDPLNLPPEIIQIILSQLDFYSLVRCLGVSKSWYQTLTAPGYKRIWRRLHFTSPRQRHAPSIASLKKLLAYAGNDVREILISNGIRFRLTNTKFLALLNGSRALERLEIRQPFESFHVPAPPNPSLRVLTRLTDLILDGFVNGSYGENVSTIDFPYTLFQDASESLQYLHLRGDAVRMASLTSTTSYWPMMPHLRGLRLESVSTAGNGIYVPQLAQQTPLLEQLWLEKTPMDLYVVPNPRHRGIWVHLKALLVTGIRARTLLEARALSFASSKTRSTNLQHLDLELDWREQPGVAPEVPTIFPAMEMAFPPHDTNQGYKNLQCLRLKQVQFDPQRVQSALEPSLQYANLRTLDIVFPLENPDSPIGQASVNHLKGYNWIKGADSISCIGVFGFRFVRYPRNSEEFPLPDFLASFKNLETLEISSEEYEDVEFSPVIADILKVTHLKIIYQNRVKGVALDQLTTLAESRGVKLVWGERPRLWPVPLE